MLKDMKKRYGSRNLIKSKPVLLIEIEKNIVKAHYETINFICELGYKPYICKNNKLHDSINQKIKSKRITSFFTSVETSLLLV